MTIPFAHTESVSIRTNAMNHKLSPYSQLSPSGNVAMRASSQVRKFSTKLLATLALVLTAICGTVNAADEVVFFSVDALGSATAAFNENGDLCWRQTYTPYGQQTNNDDASPPPGCGLIGKDRGYTGHTQDESGLTYMQQRYYDASIGRFLSIDPMGVSPSDPRTYNRYSYAANNPYKFVDPDGQLFFLAAAPLLKAAAVFIAKEAAAEAASQLTGGATDVLSARRMTKRGLIGAAKLFDPKDAQEVVSDVVPKGGDTKIFRKGTSKESPTRLNRKAQEAENSNLGIHGVSGSKTKTPGCSSASCSDLEAAGFKVHQTPSRRDPNHVTVELPKPVTKDDATRFNDVFGR